uniref:Uncharacterized protein n=1 Tax=Panagrellus redivivus TaxID=6233 RepID=A0A7E4V6R9_PANRE
MARTVRLSRRKINRARRQRALNHILPRRTRPNPRNKKPEPAIGPAVKERPFPSYVSITLGPPGQQNQQLQHDTIIMTKGTKASLQYGPLATDPPFPKLCLYPGIEPKWMRRVFIDDIEDYACWRLDEFDDDLERDYQHAAGYN